MSLSRYIILSAEMYDYKNKSGERSKGANFTCFDPSFKDGDDRKGPAVLRFSTRDDQGITLYKKATIIPALYECEIELEQRFTGAVANITGLNLVSGAYEIVPVKQAAAAQKAAA